MAEPTIAANATALPAQTALIRLSGPAAFAIARDAGLVLPEPETSGSGWPVLAQRWALGPVRLLAMAGPRTATGHDTVELRLPGAPDLVERALSRLVGAGAVSAIPGAFTRQALATGRISLDQAEAVLALTHAPDAAAAGEALARLAGALARELGPLRDRLLHLRALVEAGLDFLDEADVRSFDPAALRDELALARDTVARFRRTEDAVGPAPRVLLVGPTNAGKSALFAALTGAPALVSPIPGTTRDYLEAPWDLGGRTVQLVDTAGWWEAAQGLDAAGVVQGREQWTGAALVLVCGAPGEIPALPDGIPPERVLRLAMKADLRPVVTTPTPASEPATLNSLVASDVRSLATSGSSAEGLPVSVVDGTGLAELRTTIAARLSRPTADPRQARLLDQAHARLAALAQALPGDDLLAEDLRQLGDLLGDLLGQTTPDDVLAHIFSRFCIGK